MARAVHCRTRQYTHRNQQYCAKSRAEARSGHSSAVEACRRGGAPAAASVAGEPPGLGSSCRLTAVFSCSCRSVLPQQAPALTHLLQCGQHGQHQPGRQGQVLEADERLAGLQGHELQFRGDDLLQAGSTGQYRAVQRGAGQCTAGAGVRSSRASKRVGLAGEGKVGGQARHVCRLPEESTVEKQDTRREHTDWWKRGQPRGSRRSGRGGLACRRSRLASMRASQGARPGPSPPVSACTII